MDDRTPQTSAAADLRRAFDRTFAEAEPASREARELFLAISIADASYVLRLRDVAALVMLRRITALPTKRPELLGLIGHRGALVPVFDLGALIGHAPCKEPRWLVLCGTGEAVGLAFARVAGQVEAAPTEVRQFDAGARHPHIEAVLAGVPPRAVIAVASILDTIMHREP